MKQMTTIHNVETGEIVEREMTAAEIAAGKEADDLMQAEREAAAAKAIEKAALLAKLGITADEAKLLLS
jgi:hypothetical protein